MSNSSGRRVAGVDFGSDSVRVVVVDVDSGESLATVSRPYPRWSIGLYCKPRENQFRQHPLDYIETLEACFTEIAIALGPNSVEALAIDATGSSPAPVNSAGVPLALLPNFADDPDAMFWLWKDRTATQEALEVDAALKQAAVDYTSLQGGYSPEWWWAKILRAVRVNEGVRKDAVSWVEQSDWMANWLTGAPDVYSYKRNACAAGHKALFSRHLGGMVPREVLFGIDSYLADLSPTFRVPPAVAGTVIGTLTAEWAAKLRLRTNVVVAVGSLDAHAGAVAAGVAQRTLVKVVGTSTVDLFVTSLKDVEGRRLSPVCGLAEDSIIPGLLGGEAGQAAFGDLFAWFARLLSWPSDRSADLAVGGLLSALEREAGSRGPTDVVALDWINGRRYPAADENARAAFVNLRIGHDAVDLYQSLVQAAVLGSKSIYEELAGSGIQFDRVVLVGGVAQKSPYICQALSDAMNIDVMVHPESEVCARGAAIFAAVGAGYFNNVEEAQDQWGTPFHSDFSPRPKEVSRYNRSFKVYKDLAASVGTDISKL